LGGSDLGVKRKGWEGKQQWRGMGGKGPKSGETWVGRGPGEERDGGQGTQEWRGMSDKEPRSEEG